MAGSSNLFPTKRTGIYPKLDIGELSNVCDACDDCKRRISGCNPSSSAKVSFKKAGKIKGYSETHGPPQIETEQFGGMNSSDERSSDPQNYGYCDYDQRKPSQCPICKAVRRETKYGSPPVDENTQLTRKKSQDRLSVNATTSIWYPIIGVPVFLALLAILLYFLFQNPTSEIKKEPRECYNKLKSYKNKKSNIFRGAFYEAGMLNKSVIVVVIINSMGDMLFEHCVDDFIDAVNECYHVKRNVESLESPPQTKERNLLVNQMAPISSDDAEKYFHLDHKPGPSVYFVPLIHNLQKEEKHFSSDDDLCIYLLRSSLKIDVDKRTALASRVCLYVLNSNLMTKF